MKPTTIARIIRHQYFRGGLRSTYWTAAAVTRELRALLPAPKHAFRNEVIRSQWRFAAAMVQPVRGETQERARAAAQWLLLAQAASPDDGVSLGYFPCDSDKSGEGAGWRASYPETTGYIITSLLAYSAQFDDAAAAAAAMRMAAWETAVQMPSGAVQGGPVCPPERQTAAIFNTGMVLDGWCSAYSHSGDPKLMDAARRAADFLVNDLDEQGYFKTNGDFVSAGEIKTYTCLCAWAIYRFGELARDEAYQREAVRVIEAALRQQQPNGWFAHNCLTHSDAPLTHTIGYTLQGVLEVGVLAGRPDFIDAVRRSVDAILPRMQSSGYLPGRFYADWEPAGFSSCLTGSAQIAIIAYRLFELTGESNYRMGADKLLDFLKALQLCQSDDAAVVGALAGSFPLMGSYMRAGYPNWATKYFLDALLLQQRLSPPSMP
ncbi:MAG: glycoside hydrolase family protein [Rhodoferax sp.]